MTANVEEASLDACTLLMKDCFLEVAGNLCIDDTIKLRGVCATCADLAGDANLSAKYIEWEGWTSDFEVFRPRLSRVASTPLQGSVESQYCRRRFQMRQLCQAIPELVHAWQTGNSNQTFAMSFFAAALAARFPTEDPAEAEDFHLADVLFGETSVGQSRLVAGEETLHLVGDLTEILGSGSLPWRCGPMALFDRLECISVNPYHDVDLVLELQGSCETEEGSDSDDASPAPIFRFPAALAEWSRRDLRKVNEDFVGKKLVLPWNGDEHAAQPLPPRACSLQDETPDDILFVSRGGNTFVSKVQNVAAGGAAGAVIYNHEEGPLFRMAGGASEEVEGRANAVLVSKSVSQEIRNMMNRGHLVIRGVEECKIPKTFVRIGGTDANPREKEKGIEIWIASDPRAQALGYVLMVPHDCRAATILAHNLFDFLRGMIDLDRENTSFLRRRAPDSIQALHAAAKNELTAADFISLLATRPAHTQTAADISSFLSLMTSGGMGLHEAGRSGNSASSSGGASNSNPISGAWDKDLNCFSIRMPRRIKSGWLVVEGGDKGFEIFRILKSNDEMSVEAILDACDLDSDARRSVLVSTHSAEVMCGDCLLVEEQVEKSCSSRDGGETSCRRGFRGATTIFDRVQRIAPEYMKQRWKCSSNGSEEVSSCEVSFVGGQLCVKWSNPSGFRGSFLKPLRNLFEIFVALPPTLQASHMIKPGDSVLIPVDKPPSDMTQNAAVCQDQKDGTEKADSRWEEDRSLDEPDGAWCLRQTLNPHDKHGTSALPACEEDIHADEEIVLFYAQRDPCSGNHERLPLDLDSGDQDCLRPLSHRCTHFILGRTENANQADNATAAQTTRLDTIWREREERVFASESIASADEDVHPAASSSGSAVSSDSIHATDAVDLPSEPNIDTPHFRLHVLSPERLHLEIFPASANSARDLALDISETSVRVTSVDGHQEELEIALPFSVDPTSARAHFSKRKRQLEVWLTGSAVSLQEHSP